MEDRAHRGQQGAALCRENVFAINIPEFKPSARNTRTSREAGSKNTVTLKDTSGNTGVQTGCPPVEGECFHAPIPSMSPNFEGV